MRVLLALAVVCLLAGAGTAEAVGLRTPDGRVAQPYQRWANRALVPTAPGRVTVSEEACPDGSWACYVPAWRAIYIDGRGNPRAWVRGQFLHELGHRYDEWLHARRAAHRPRFDAIMALGRPWWTGLADDPHASPGELFADGYSACAERRRIDAYSQLDVFALGGEYAPTPAEHLRVCALLRRAFSDRTRRIP